MIAKLAAGAAPDLGAALNAGDSAAAVAALRPELLAFVSKLQPNALPDFLDLGAEAKALAKARLEAALRPSAESGTGDRRGRCLTPEAITGRLPLPESKVYDLLRAGAIRGFKEGKYWLVPEEEVERYVADGMKRSAIRGV